MNSQIQHLKRKVETKFFIRNGLNSIFITHLLIMKRILILFILFISTTVNSQVFELPDSLQNATYEKTLHYLNGSINAIKPWNAKKVELQLCKVYWLTYNWDYPKAQEVFETIPFERVKRYNLQGDYWLMQAILLKYNNEPELSQNNYSKSIRFFKKQKNIDAALFARIELAEFYRKIGNYDIGLQELNEIEAYFSQKNKSRNSKLYLKLLNRKAAILNETSKLNSSITYSQKSLEIAKEINSKLSEAISYNELGFSYKNLSSEITHGLDSSIHYYKLSEAMFRELGLQCEALQVKYNWVTAYSHHRKFPELVIQGYIEIIQEVERRQIPFQLKDVYSNLMTEYAIKKDFENAFLASIKHREALIEFIENLKRREIQKIEAEYTAFQLETENQAIRKASIRKDYELKRQKRQNQIYLIILVALVGLVVSLFWLFRKNRKLSDNLLVKNKEKDVLIQEVHHRVKNNMQFISTLLEMQQGSSKNVNESIVLQDANVRVASMSLVHEMLYQDDNGELIMLPEYIHNLLDLLKDSFNIQENEVLVHLKIDPVLVTPQQATAIGLIINEFFSNSVKHAFFTTENPEFHLTVEDLSDSNEFVLTMWDNGPGTEQEIESSRSLGVKLIRLLTNQLKAKGEWKTKSNFHYSIKIPL